MIRRQRLVLLMAEVIGMSVIVAAADLPAQGQLKGLFRLQADGSSVYQSDVYRVAFNRDGAMSSLQVKGQEFLRPVAGEAGGAGFFVNGKRVILPSTQPSAEGGLIADGNRGTFLHMEADRLDIDVGQETPNARVEFVFFPAYGISQSPVEGAAMRGTRPEKWQIVGTQATRWTAPDGTAIEIHYDGQPVKDYNGAAALPVAIPYKTRICGEIRFPLSAWGSAKATVAWEAAVEDHNFAKGTPIAVSGTVTLTAPTEAALEAVLQVEDLNTAEVVHAERQPLALAGGKSAPFQFSLAWDKPGPWRVNAVAVAGDHAIGVKSGTVVYDLDSYRPPLCRPDDFWEFWQKAIAAQRSLPLDAVLMKDEKASTPEYTIYTVYITGYQGRRLQGSYGEPTAAGRHPVTIGAGHPGTNVTAPKEEAVCNLITYMDGMATYRTGLGSRYTSNLFYNYIDALRWVDFLATCDKADLDRSIYFAGSRSGPVGIAVLALDPRVKMYIANVPTNNRWDWQVTLPGAGGWGPWAGDRQAGQTMEDFTRELSYFNSDNFAERVTQPCLIGFGLLDGLSQVTGNLACYARLASPKKKICFRAWWGHADATPEWYETSTQWRKELFGHP